MNKGELFFDNSQNIKNSVNERKSVMKKKVSERDRAFSCFIMLIVSVFCCIAFLIVSYANIGNRAYLDGMFVTLLSVVSIWVARHYIKTVRKKESIQLNTHLYTNNELLRSILEFPLQEMLHRSIAEQLVRNLVDRMTRVPGCLGTIDRVRFLISRFNSLLSPEQIAVFLGGVKVEELTLEQIEKILDSHINLQTGGEVWWEFQIKLLRLREERERHSEILI